MVIYTREIGAMFRAGEKASKLYKGGNLVWAKAAADLQPLVTGNPAITEGVSFAGLAGRSYVWSEAGTIQFLQPKDAHYLIVAGGGSGGKATYGGSAGGGGGGVIEGSFSFLDEQYEIAVGAGGAAIVEWAPINGNNGGNSSLIGAGISLTAIGGGGGAGGDVNGNNGGSGGGAGYGSAPGNGTAGQGNRGGDGGGGGADAIGGNGTGEMAGAGGAGRSSSISGAALVYGSGGGTGVEFWAPDRLPGAGGDGAGSGGGAKAIGGDAVPGRGGGGGGSGGDSARSGNAGSGVVAIFVPD